MTKTQATPGRSDQTSYPSLARMLGDPVAFLSTCWTRRPVLHRSDTGSGFADILDPASIDAIVDTRLREPYVRASKDGRPLSAERFMRPTTVQGAPVGGGALSVDDLAREFSGGATIILDGIDHYHEPVTDLCLSLSAELKAPVEAVAFVTPAEVQGLEVHYDNVEVFVIQLAGSKKWTVYQQVRPLVKKGRVVSKDSLGAPVLEAVINPGDCLYIPRGAPHYAVAVDSVSCHLSVMVMPGTWAAILSEFIKSTITTSEYEPVGVGAAGFPVTLAQEARDRVDQAMSDLRARNAAEFLTGYLSSAVRSAPSRAGFLEQAARRADMDAGSRVRRDDRMSYVVGPAEHGQVEVRIGERKFRYPALARSTLKSIEYLGETVIGEIPSALSEAGLLELAGHLVDNGALRLSDPQGELA